MAYPTSVLEKLKEMGMYVRRLKVVSDRDAVAAHLTPWDDPVRSLLCTMPNLTEVYFDVRTHPVDSYDRCQCNTVAAMMRSFRENLEPTCIAVEVNVAVNGYCKRGVLREIPARTKKLEISFWDPVLRGDCNSDDQEKGLTLGRRTHLAIMAHHDLAAGLQNCKNTLEKLVVHNPLLSNYKNFWEHMSTFSLDELLSSGELSFPGLHTLKLTGVSGIVIDSTIHSFRNIRLLDLWVAEQSTELDLTQNSIWTFLRDADISLKVLRTDCAITTIDQYLLSPAGGSIDTLEINLGNVNVYDYHRARETNPYLEEVKSAGERFFSQVLGGMKDRLKHLAITPFSPRAKWPWETVGQYVDMVTAWTPPRADMIILPHVVSYSGFVRYRTTTDDIQFPEYLFDMFPNCKEFYIWIIVIGGYMSPSFEEIKSQYGELVQGAEERLKKIHPEGELKVGFLGAPPMLSMKRITNHHVASPE